MKKLLITLLFVVAAITGVFAAPKKVSSAILANFESQFETASDVTWLVTNDYTKAAFIEDDRTMEVYYNPNGDIIASSRSITMDELPVNAKRIFAKKFAGYTVTEAIRLEGFGEDCYYISGENEKDTVIYKVDENNEVSLYKRQKNK
jgi:hypothetical protein